MVGFTLQGASLTLNGSLRGENITLSADPFHWMFIWVKDTGLFRITDLPGSFRLPDGHFRGNRVEIDFEGTRIVLESRAAHVFDDGVDREAHMDLLRNFSPFAPGVEPTDVVIGLVEDFRQIPGFDAGSIRGTVTDQ